MYHYVCMYVVHLLVLQLEFKGGVLGTAGMMGNNLVLTHMFLVDSSIHPYQRYESIS